MFFLRFYFISNDDLLAICSNTKTPAAIQPYLKKCFEGINELCIDLNNMLTGMKSDMGDVVNFLEKINPADSNGQPELWLCEVCILLIYFRICFNFSYVSMVEISGI